MLWKVKELNFSSLNLHPSDNVSDGDVNVLMLILDCSEGCLMLYLLLFDYEMKRLTVRLQRWTAGS
jgi:hypothetical protein